MNHFQPEILEEESKLINKIIFSRREPILNDVNGKNILENLEENLKNNEKKKSLITQINRRIKILNSLENHLMSKMNNF